MGFGLEWIDNLAKYVEICYNINKNEENSEHVLRVQTRSS